MHESLVTTPPLPHLTCTGSAWGSIHPPGPLAVRALATAGPRPNATAPCNRADSSTEGDADVDKADGGDAAAAAAADGKLDKTAPAPSCKAEGGRRAQRFPSPPTMCWSEALPAALTRAAVSA